MGLSGDPAIFAIGHLCFFQLLNYILSAISVKSLELLLFYFYNIHKSYEYNIHICIIIMILSTARALHINASTLILPIGMKVLA